MSEPASASLAGMKYGTLIAGFAGALISLSYAHRELSRLQMGTAIAIGIVTSNYMTPMVMLLLGPHLRISEVVHGVAFLIGLTAMNVVPGVLNLASQFRKNPRSFLPGDKQ